MSFTILFLLFEIISFNSIQDAFGLMCYQCNSLHDSHCEFIHKEDKFSLNYKYCNPLPNASDIVTEYRTPLCRKIVQKIRVRDNMKVVQRSCGWVLYKNVQEDICYDVVNNDHEEVVCQCFDDGCNASTKTATNLFLISFSIVLSILLNSLR